ncbi:MAG: hypothetical protein ABI388_07305 [Bacteroidia bacterium]
MNIREALLQEHSKTQTLKVVAYIGNDKKLFAELMKLMFTTEYRVEQRAAWVVSCCMDKNKTLLNPWISKLIKNLENRNIHDAVKRNTLRALQNMDISEKHCGELYDSCYTFLHSIKEPIAVRAFALTVLTNISKKYPELKTEILHSAESLLRCGIPALESRSRQAIKELTKK